MRSVEEVDSCCDMTVHHESIGDGDATVYRHVVTQSSRIKYMESEAVIGNNSSHWDYCSQDSLGDCLDITNVLVVVLTPSLSGL